MCSFLASRRAQLRAAIIAYFVFFNALAALPTLGVPSAERLDRPFEQAELRRWQRMLAAVGVEISAQRLAQLYLSLAEAAEQAHQLALAPIAGFASLTQTEQRWRLFGTPDEQRSVLRISAFAGEREEVLYESLSPEYRWGAERLEYRRVRAAYNPSRAGPPPTYEGLGLRLSEQIFAQRPELTRVRIVLDRSRVPLPGAAPDPEHEEQYALEFARPAP
ncbi:MAG TPA: hypothetical protein VFS67_20535 [Polyangiaceae bacterium]|jgi:hypothetical protein|nr:hypothetical protein [Polyangiaceae bacterium]